MSTLAGPMVDQIVKSADVEERWGLREAFNSMVVGLINLDYMSWHRRFESDGIPDEQIAKLDSIVLEWIKTIDSDGLSRMLEDVRDLGDELEMAGVVGTWMEQVPQERVSTAISDACLPNRFEAVCYAVSELGRVINGAIEFETMSRELAEQGKQDGTLTPEQVSRGIAMAEAGLAEDVKAWSRS